MFSYKDYIYAIYRERSFSKAAQKLFVSQSWLSSVVKKTEQEIKAPPFRPFYGSYFHDGSRALLYPSG